MSQQAMELASYSQEMADDNTIGYDLEHDKNNTNARPPVEDEADQILSMLEEQMQQASQRSPVNRKRKIDEVTTIEQPAKPATPPPSSSPKRAPRPAVAALNPPLYPGEPKKANDTYPEGHPLRLTARLRRVAFPGWVYDKDGNHKWTAQNADAEPVKAIRPEDEEEDRFKQIAKTASKRARASAKILDNQKSDHFNCNAIFHPRDMTQLFDVANFIGKKIPEIEDQILRAFEDRGVKVTHRLHKDTLCDNIVAYMNRSMAYYEGGKHPYLVAKWDPKKERIVAREFSAHNLKEMLKQKIEFTVNKDEGSDKTTVVSLTLFTIWSTHPNRRSISSTIFDTRWHYDVPKSWEPNYYNEWAGYAWTYEEARCAYITDHGQRTVKYFLEEVAFKVISNSNKSQYQFLMDWVAYAYQFPWVKLASIIIMYSAKTRCGKNFFANTVFKGFGHAFQVTADKKKLHARFNSHLARLLVQFIDEIDFSRDTELMEYLKSMTTEDRLQMEEKGKETDEYKITTRLMCATNNRTYMKCNLGSMRFAGYELSTHQSMKIEEFWNPLAEALSKTVDGMTDVGYKAIFFYFMYDHVVSNEFKVSRGENVPVSELQKEQEAASMSSVMSFLEKIIDDQEHINPFALSDTVPANDARFAVKDDADIGNLMSGREEVRRMHRKTDVADLRIQARDNQLGFEVEEQEGKNWVTVVSRNDLHDAYKKFYYSNPEQKNKRDFKDLSPFMGVVGEVFERNYSADNSRYVLDRKNIKTYIWPTMEIDRNMAMTKEGFDLRAQYATSVKARVRYVVLPDYAEARKLLKKAMGVEVEADPEPEKKKARRGLRVSIDDKTKWSLDLITKASRPCIMYKVSNGKRMFEKVTGRPIKWTSVVGYRTAEDSCYYKIQGLPYPGKEMQLHRQNVSHYTYDEEEITNLDLMMAEPTTIVMPASTPEHMKIVESQPDIVMIEKMDLASQESHSAHSVAARLILPPTPDPTSTPKKKGVRRYSDGMVEKDEESEVEIDEEEELRGQGGAESLDSEDSLSGDSADYQKGDWRSKLQQEDVEGFATPESGEEQEKHSFEELLSDAEDDD